MVYILRPRGGPIEIETSQTETDWLANFVVAGFNREGLGLGCGRDS
jgi:hypothetical protein